MKKILITRPIPDIAYSILEKNSISYEDDLFVESDVIFVHAYNGKNFDNGENFSYHSRGNGMDLLE